MDDVKDEGHETEEGSPLYVQEWTGCQKFVSFDTIAELRAFLEEELATVKAMEAAGVELDPHTDGHFFRLVTSDAEVAKRFDMQEEDWGDEAATSPEGGPGDGQAG